MVAMNAETYARDVREVASGGYLHLRQHLAAAGAAGARRHHGARRAARETLQRELQRRAHAHPHEEHLLRGRARRAARSRHRENPRIARRDLREEAGARRFEHEGDRARLQLRDARTSSARCRMQVAPLPDAASKTARPHPHRRQHRRRPRLRVRRRDGRRVVSDHAVDLADGRVQECSPTSCASIPRPARRISRSSRPKTSSPRSAWCWAPTGMARARSPRPSGPGVSLMNEFLGLAYYAEVPAVLFDIQRVGPSTGMPTRTQQCDILEGAYASHGDTKHVCLFPRDPEECFYFARDAFDLAERLQTPIMVMSDLDIGMNDWMCPDLKWDDNYVPDRGKVLHEGRDREDREIPSLSRRRRRRHSLPHAARRASRRARISRAARATRSTARTPRIPPNTRSCSTASRASSRTAKRLVPKPVIEQDAHIDIARRRLRQLRRRGARGARHPRPRTASRPTTCACARSRSARTSRNSSSSRSWCS